MFFLLTLVLPRLPATRGTWAGDQSIKGEAENEAFVPRSLGQVLPCY